MTTQEVVAGFTEFVADPDHDPQYDPPEHLLARVAHEIVESVGQTVYTMWISDHETQTLQGRGLDDYFVDGADAGRF